MSNTKNVYIDISLKAPRWHVINVNHELDMQKFEQETSKCANDQNPLLISYLKQKVRSYRMELKHINNTTGIFN